MQQFIQLAHGFRSREAASFFAQMEDQSQRLREAVEGITLRELEWQAAPGMNTIGMLLAHLAVAEVLWAQVALLDMAEADTKPVLGIARADDGMPIAADGKHPAVLEGRTLAEYEVFLARARLCYRDAALKLTDADMDREVSVSRPGGKRTFNIRWAMYHVLEHFAGHFGQVLLLRHLYRAA